MPTSNQFQQLMDEFKKTHEDMQHKINQLQEDITTSQEDAAERLVKKLKANYAFVLKGHKQQFLFNLQVKDKILKARLKWRRSYLQKHKKPSPYKT